MSVGRLIGGVAVLGIGIFLNWLLLPAWSIESIGMWFFILAMAIIAVVIFGLVESFEYVGSFTCTIASGVVAGIAVVGLLIGGLSSWALFRADDYHHIIEIEEGNFEEDVSKMSEDSFWPIVDLETAQKVGDRSIGSVKNASWYEVSDEYDLIKYKGEYYRISDLQYGGLFKYNKAKAYGIPGYVLVNIATQEAQYVDLEDPIRYAPTGHFEHRLKRHLRNEYPSYIFSKSFFEIDDEGTPYYITGIQTPTIGFSGKKQDRVVITNAVTGENKIYDISDLPEWVDHAFGVSYLMKLVENNQSYINGFWNNLFSKTGVNRTSYYFEIHSTEEEEETVVGAGYNTAITSTGEIVFYTGVTPASNAETNIGFILASPRSGEVKFYSCTGADEYSAQKAAEGLVSNLRYTATFPTIINVDGEETYFMLLKDGAGLVQRYALCNVENYTKVVQAETIEEVLGFYRGEVNIEAPESTNIKKASGTISNIYRAEIGGFTYFYFTLGNSDKLYMSSIENSNKQVMLDVGTSVKLSYVASSEEGVYIVKEISF